METECTRTAKVWMVLVAACLLLGRVASAQTIDLAQSGTDLIYSGVAAGDRAGTWFDKGAVSRGDSRPDLIVGAPGSSSVPGSVYVLFGGPVPQGHFSLSNADAELSGSANGDGFGTSTAAGNIITAQGSATRNLAVGAPGALSGRGAVYVFKGPLDFGATVAASSRDLEIRGAAGDRLGTMLATADLDGDGYRELIAGAPGNNRVYIIHGGPALSGVIDLTTTPAYITLTAPGIGSVLAAGDITGDNIYDLIVGASSANTVYVLNGRNGGGFPATIDLQTSASAKLDGINPGDEAGSSLGVADIDGDGERDLIVGAAAGDGPDNARIDCGEAYILWGGAPITSRNLAYSNVLIWGRVAGGRFGTAIAVGDVNRDRPNDLAILAPAATDAGEVDVYYGRARSGIGRLLTDGRRIVDLAQSGQISRAIVGDASVGGIVSTQIYEETGEGANDIIAGVPAADANAGWVYFTISPKMILGTRSVSLVATQGRSVTLPVDVVNPSTIWITWQGTGLSGWLGTSSGASVASSTGHVNITASAASLAPGTYVGTVRVASTSNHLEMFRDITVTLQVAPANRAPQDFDGNGRPDIVWRHGVTGSIAVWRLNGYTVTSSQFTTPAQVTDLTWNIVGTADFNADGNPDLVWFNRTTGAVTIWLMSGTTLLSNVTPNPGGVADTNWQLRATGDMNGDGRPDLLWERADNGLLAVWLMNGTTLIESRLLTPNQVSTPRWQIVATGDFNGDHRADIVWQNLDTGYVAIWYMNGTTLISSGMTSPSHVADLDWRVAGVADFDGDGKPDLLWHHRTQGYVGVWLMNGATYRMSVSLNPSQVSDTNWKIVGPR